MSEIIKPTSHRFYLALGTVIETLPATSGKPGIWRWQDNWLTDGDKGFSASDLKIAPEIEISEMGDRRSLDLPQGLTPEGIEFIERRLGVNECLLPQGQRIVIDTWLNKRSVMIVGDTEFDFDSNLEQALIFVLGLWYNHQKDEDRIIFENMVREADSMMMGGDRDNVGEESLSRTIDRHLTDAQQLANLLGDVDWVEGGYIPSERVVLDLIEDYLIEEVGPLPLVSGHLDRKESYCRTYPWDDARHSYWVEDADSLLYGGGFLGKQIVFSYKTWTHVHPEWRGIDTEPDEFEIHGNRVTFELKFFIKSDGQIVIGGVDESGQSIPEAIILRDDSERTQLADKVEDFINDFGKKMMISSNNVFIRWDIRRGLRITPLELISKIERMPLVERHSIVDIDRLKWLLAAWSWPGEWGRKLRQEVSQILGFEKTEKSDSILRKIAQELVPLVWYLGGAGLDDVRWHHYYSADSKKCDEEWIETFSGGKPVRFSYFLFPWLKWPTWEKSQARRMALLEAPKQDLS